MPRRVAAVFLHYGVDDVYLLQVMEGFFFHLFFFYFFSSWDINPMILAREKEGNMS